MDHTMADLWVKRLNAFLNNENQTIRNSPKMFQEEINTRIKFGLYQIIYGRTLI